MPYDRIVHRPIMAADPQGYAMTSVYIVSSGGSGAPALGDDLAKVGIDVLGSASLESMVQDVVRVGPDLVICFDSHPDDALFAGTTALRNVSPRPVVVFTPDPDAEKIERATASGIHAYVVNGYGLHRLRSVIHLAKARFRHDQLLLEELSDVQNKFSERKLVDRAKGILMRVRNIGEDEAYKVLRSAAMSANLRIGQIAQQVIDASRYAEAVNRSGQLRMLSQRIVALYALICTGKAGDGTTDICRDCIEQAEANIAVLGRTLSKPTFGDLLDAVLKPWVALKAAMATAPTARRLLEIDGLAERLLVQAEALTRTLETAGFVAALKVVNVSGRQRMLSQRLAKQAIIRVLVGSAAYPNQDIGLPATAAAFAEGLTFLENSPLSTPDIRALLAEAAGAWHAFAPSLAEGAASGEPTAIAEGSEKLLALFERLTDHYERSVQILMG